MHYQPLWGEALLTLLAVLIVLLAAVFAHLGSILPKKVQDAAKKHQRAAIFFGLAVLMIVLGIPWGRPLFPGL